MKKIIVWALMATLMVAGSAFAAPSRIVANATYPTGSPATTNNDDSCDIGVAPAATLLLPYFEVDVNEPVATAESTLFTVTNVSANPTIAHVTLWTDWSFPVIDFNIFLTGYDVQSINLYDVIQRGFIQPTTSNPAATGPSPVGVRSAPNGALDTTACRNLATQLSDAYIQRMQDAFIDGFVEDFGVLDACDTVGSNQPSGNAIGYATIDVAGICSTSLPTEPIYFSSEIRYDNVLIGDYQQINGGEDFAQGNPMVHIRAIPEGGTPGSLPTNFDRTFYSRYQGGGTADRRQPLPSTFAARWIQGGGTGFETDYKIWREGVTGADAACDEYPLNGALAVTEVVRFDERENPFALSGGGPIVSPPLEDEGALPETRRVPMTDSDIIPAVTNGAVAGWTYLNLDFGAVGTPPVLPAYASQNWVIVSMRAEGRYSVDFDAAWLGNGCSPREALTATAYGAAANNIGPAPNVTPDLIP